MKVLIIHNEYGKYCGEEAVVQRMVNLFRHNGHIVRKFTRSSAEIPKMPMGKARAFLSALYNPFAIRKLSALLDDYRPDLVNIHNLYPFISPLALFEIKKREIPVVMTVHNFRLLCPSGLFARHGKTCEECLAGGEWNCVKHNCENSLLKSTGYALRNWVARVSGAYTSCVTRYACITDFQRQKMIKAGFDPEKIVVIPNFLEEIHLTNRVKGEYVGYAGRLSAEKGIDMILEVARRHPEIPFRLAGELRPGRESDESFSTLLHNLPNVQWVGHLSGHRLHSFYRNSAFMVMASHWYEGFPMSVLDAAGYRKTTVAPERAGFCEIIDYDPELTPFYDKPECNAQEFHLDTMGRNSGLLFEPENADDFERKVVWLWNHPQWGEQLGDNAHRKLHRYYSAYIVSKQWESLVKSIVREKSLFTEQKYTPRLKSVQTFQHQHSHERVLRNTVRV